MKHLRRLNLNWKNDFYSILEKRIIVGDLLKDRLDDIPSYVSIAKKVSDFLYSDDIKDVDITKVDYTNKDDKVLTITDSKNKVSKRSINKLLTYLGFDYTDIEPIEIQTFITYFSHKLSDYFKEVKGNDILSVYLESNYDISVKTNSKDNIYGSCMRYETCQDYLEIYTANPNQVSCLTLFNPTNDKVQGRALIWNTDDGKRFMDKIYASIDAKPLFITYANENRIKMTTKSTVTLDNKIDYEYYPYMDTFEYYTPDTGVLSKIDGEYRLRETNGTAEGRESEIEMIWSDYQQMNIDRNVAIWSDYLNSMVSTDSFTNCIVSIKNADNYEVDYVDNNDCYYISYFSDKYRLEVEYALKQLCTKLKNGKYVLTKDKDIYGKYNDEYYLNIDALNAVSKEDMKYCVYKVSTKYIPYTDACGVYNEKTNKIILRNINDIDKSKYSTVASLDIKKYPIIYKPKNIDNSKILSLFIDEFNINKDLKKVINNYDFIKAYLEKTNVYNVMYVIDKLIDDNISMLERLLKDDIDEKLLYVIFNNVCVKGKIDMVKSLLKDKRIDPSFSDNKIIKNTHYYKQKEVVKLLLKDKRVLDTLDKDDKEIILDSL